jgi:hypothetical protein
MTDDAIVHGTTVCALCGDVLEGGDSTLTCRERGSYAHRACAAAGRYEENFAEEKDPDLLIHDRLASHGPPELPGSRDQDRPLLPSEQARLV